MIMKRQCESLAHLSILGVRLVFVYLVGLRKNNEHFR